MLGGVPPKIHTQDLMCRGGPKMNQKMTRYFFGREILGPVLDCRGEIYPPLVGEQPPVPPAVGTTPPVPLHEKKSH